MRGERVGGAPSTSAFVVVRRGSWTFTAVCWCDAIGVSAGWVMLGGRAGSWGCCNSH